MADFGNHYERAFEEHLRTLRIPSVSVDETRRAFAGETTLKSLDFIVTSPSGQTLLIDVKGRKISPRRRTLPCWATQDDVDSLLRWQERFANSLALLVFVYHLPTEDCRVELQDCFVYADRNYGCLAVRLIDFKERMRVRSQSWRTVHIKSSDYLAIARPFSAWL